MVHVNSSNESFEITRQKSTANTSKQQPKMRFHLHENDEAWVFVNGMRGQLASQVKLGNLYCFLSPKRVELSGLKNATENTFRVGSLVARKFVFVIKHSTTVRKTFVTCNWTHITRKISRWVHTIVQVTQFASNFLSSIQKSLANRKVIFRQNWIRTNDRKLNDADQRSMTMVEAQERNWRQRKSEKFQAQKCCAALARENSCWREREISDRGESFSVPPCTSFLVYMTNLLWNSMMLTFLACDGTANTWLEMILEVNGSNESQKRFVVASPSDLCNFLGFYEVLRNFYWRR